MFCSTIIPTVDRPTFARAVQSVLEQDFTTVFQVINVNDFGSPLPEAEWQHSARVRVVDTDFREHSVARNMGAAIAKGRCLHFLDDDMFLPDALNALWSLDKQNLLTRRNP